MGLGKTIQVITFLAGLHFGAPALWDAPNFHAYATPSTHHVERGAGGAILIVCPATVIHQWVAEFHRWWPLFRVSVLHASGSALQQDKLVATVAQAGVGNVLITSYAAVRLQRLWFWRCCSWLFSVAVCC
jgi:DNA excision repair protein ERCC-6